MEFSVSSVLSLAYLLSVINYYVGLVLYAMPAPIAVKRFGLRMSYHGAIAALLVMLYGSLVYVVELTFKTLGLSWESLSSFYTRSSLLASGFYSMAALLASFRSHILGIVPDAMRNLVSIILNTAYRNLMRASILIGTSEAMVKLVASLAYHYWDKLVLLGVLLYSLPAGVGRKAGASLIASGIVLYIAVPLLPLWVNMWLDSVAKSNPIAALVGGLGYAKPTLYMLWGNVVDHSGLGQGYTIALWRGGVPLVARSGYASYIVTYPLEPGTYLLQVYAGPIVVKSRVVSIPDECLESESPFTDLLTVIQLLVNNLLYGRVVQCKYDVMLENVLMLGEHILVEWPSTVQVLSYDYNQSDDGVFVNISFEGSGVVKVCACCGCSVDSLSGIIVEKEEQEDGVSCSYYRVEDSTVIAITARECGATFSSVAPQGGIQYPLLDFLLHDIPMAVYMLAMGYAAGVWSYLMLLSLLIYGFGRVLGESGVLVIRIRY
ncbi:hypothetical protein Pyrfu_1645 [Pyrolobus fumarii 1A]|uniref:Uncharacterized protein n=1 Tax=Pyrolobus fumarii (strain DSM 11204 / 1A) TaxID=694429 RepID=G0ECD1_PYRF1|nr:hypothetical protein [Pyrolobus fumarii]AEM39501.1 hypothetical protein Pyrfu_1645 [Pyrolobus fumarii 1A]